MKETKKALELDPLSQVVNLNLATSHMNSRKYDEAIQQFQKNIETFPNYIWNYYFLAYSYAYQNKFTEAIEACEKVSELSKGSVTLCPAHVYAIEGKTAEAEKILAENTQEFEDIEYIKAMVYSLMNGKGKAFEILEKLVEKGSYVVTYMKIEQAFDNLRENQRYKDLLKKVGFPE